MVKRDTEQELTDLAARMYRLEGVIGELVKLISSELVARALVERPFYQAN